MKQFAKYSKYYDTIYGDKDYSKEVSFVKELWNKYAKRKVKSVLSLGCGTCRHEILLAKENLNVTGIDRSPEMIRIAKERLRASGESIKLYCKDITLVNLKQKFDAIVTLFNIIGYMNSDRSLDKYFATCSSHLSKGGVLIFDGWYQPAVLKHPPLNKKIVIKGDTGESITRFTKQNLDVKRSILDINFVLDIKKSDNNRLSISENHPMRFYTLSELSYAASIHGFEIVNASLPFKANEPVSLDNWNMWVVMRKI